MAMTPSTSDILLLGIVGGLAVYWLFGDKFFGNKPDNDFAALAQKPSAGMDDGESDRDFVAKMKKQNKKAVIFYGSQTGTAEDYATRIAKEAKSRFGVSSLVADPEEYDFNTLDQLTEDQLAFFVVATYGEGEPTDNAVAMADFLKDPDAQFSKGGDLSNLKYVVFALGNRTYEMFCEMGKVVDSALSKRDATRIYVVGMGDDDKSMEEDYLAWKDGMWEAVQKELGWEEGAGGDTADFEVKEVETPNEQKVYRGELSARALTGTRGVFDAKNPYPAPIVTSRELFSSGERNCVHVEFDIQDTGIRYQTGDHVGVWPLNPDSEVERLLKLLGLWEKRESVVEITSLDPALAKVPFPSPASYDAIFRHYIDVSMVASRQLLFTLSKYAPTETAKANLERIGGNKDVYHEEVGEKCLKLGEVLMLAAGDNYTTDPQGPDFKPTVWTVPFDRIVSSVPRLQPRFYSISSSPKLYPNHIHVTAVVLKYDAGDKSIYGCGTNYILNLKMTMHNEFERLEHQDTERQQRDPPKYRIEGPRSKYLKEGKMHAPVHVRRSNFRLPTSPKIPVVMIGPGTGVAPFRAFVQERVALARKAKDKDGPDALSGWGTITLYFGCRTKDGDFLYRDEWEEYARVLEGKFKMYTALSREAGLPKKYVQHLIDDTRSEIADAIMDKKGFLYICGDARNMARDVEDRLRHIFAEHKGGSADKEGVAEVKLLKDRNRMLLDVWS